jgi:hypothetical protein
VIAGIAAIAFVVIYIPFCVGRYAASQGYCPTILKGMTYPCNHDLTGAAFGWVAVFLITAIVVLFIGICIGGSCIDNGIKKTAMIIAVILFSIFSIIKTFQYWWILNCYLIETNWIWRFSLDNGRLAPVDVSAFVWIIFQASFLAVCGLIVFVLWATWKDYRSKMIQFDREREKKID